MRCQHGISAYPLHINPALIPSSPLLKNQLWSGAWSLLILSNNGVDGAPIAFERDFLLDVGSQTTISMTPTVTASTVVVPTINTTTTTTTTSTKTLPPSTTTVPSTTVQKTSTVTPQPVWSTKTITLATVTIPKVSVTVSKVVKTVTASCHVPSRQPSPDPFCKIWPSQASAQQIVKSAAYVANVPTPSLTKASAKFGNSRNMYSWLQHDRAQWLRARDERLGEIQGVGRRAPDAQPLTVTEQDSSKFITVTSTSTTSAVTSTNYGKLPNPEDRHDTDRTRISHCNCHQHCHSGPGHRHERQDLLASVYCYPGHADQHPHCLHYRQGHHHEGPDRPVCILFSTGYFASTNLSCSITITTTLAPAASKTACHMKGGTYY